MNFTRFMPFASRLLALLFAFTATHAHAEELQPVPCSQIAAAMQPLVGNYIPGTAVTRVATKGRVLRPNAVSW